MKLSSLIKWIAIGAATLFLIAIAWGTLSWKKISGAHPIYDGEVSVEGVRNDVVITRDQYAIPHIEASSEVDALFGLGFVHAQDRFWQMTLIKYFTQGRLSELFGEAALPSDFQVRNLNLRDVANESLSAYSADDLKRLNAYVAGVNAWLTSDAYVKPAEFRIIRFETEAWTAEDTVYASLAQWLGLAAAMNKELESELFEESLDSSIIEIISNLYPDDGHVALELSDLANTMGFDVADSLSAGDAIQNSEVSNDVDFRQSNNWVVSGEHTRSGAAQLAGDPHLAFTMPGTWYLAHMKFGNSSRVGGTTAGSPVVYMGHTQKLAFSSTIHLRDVQDISIETVHPEDPTRYLTPNGFEPFLTREETFRVRGGEEVTRTFKASRNGPVILEDIYDPKPIHGENTVASLKWTLTSATENSIPSVFKINSAQSFEELIEVTKRYHGLDVNMVFASTNGDIGMMVAGRAPIRLDEHETGGKRPASGSNSENDWQGFYGPDQVPLVVNPDSGVLVSANAKVIPDGFPYSVNTYFAPPARQQRIQDLIEETSSHDFDTFRTIQLDGTSPDVLPALRQMTNFTPTDESLLAALEILKEWDGDWRAKSPAAMIFAQWSSTLMNGLVLDELDAPLAFEWYNASLYQRRILENQESPFCDDRRTNVIETCAHLLESSLKEALGELASEYGNDQSDWLFSKHFQQPIPHLGLSELPIIGDKLSRTVTITEGDGVSVGPGAPNVAFYDVHKLPDLVGLGVGAAYRFIIDMSDVDNAQFIVSSGQSGHFSSPHYDDLYELWKRGEYVKIPTDLSLVEARYQTELVPTP